jgi:hypothetical protein
MIHHYSYLRVQQFQLEEKLLQLIPIQIVGPEL